ncbi:MAG: hypothetical protein HOP19_18210 [Acidobacteria bacterium]|nr:hypothetical protein [Acidobacteriota bacterium]
MLERGESTDAIQAEAQAPVNGSSAELEREKLRAQILAQGHKFYGIFADDPGAMEVFDEIEKARNEFTLADLSDPK